MRYLREMTGRDWLLALGAILPGIAGVAIFGAYALLDWAELQRAYTVWAHAAAGSGDMRAVFVAESNQNIHRINLFADGVWTLLAAILAAIGLHGLPRKRSKNDE